MPQTLTVPAYLLDVAVLRISTLAHLGRVQTGLLGLERHVNADCMLEANNAIPCE